MRALIYLTVRRFLNSIKQIPRQPRLLVPYLFIGFFLVITLAGPLLVSGMRPPGGRGLSPAFTPTEFVEGGPGALMAAVRAVLLLSVLTSVVQALGEGNLFFTQSDVDFLFPAPLSRRAVLLFKMLGRYAGMIVPAAYLPLFLGSSLVARAGVTPLAYAPGILGAWLFMVTTANLAQTALLARTGGSDDLTDDEARAKRRERGRRIASVLTTVLLVGGLGLVFFLAGDRQNRGLLREVLRVVNSDAATVLLAPIAWASDLYRVAFEGWSLADAGRLLGLLALAGGSLALLFSRDRDFYEGAMDFSQKHARMAGAMRQGDAGTILSQMAQDGKLAAGRTLRDFGVGARAILWKDAVSLTRTPLRSWLTLLFLAAFPAFFGLMIGRRQSDAALVFWLTMFTVQTSSLFLLGLRDMLRRADITKAFPVSPTRLLVAELAFSVLQMTVLGWISMSVLWLLGSGRGPLFAPAFVAFPSVATLIIFVQTCFVLLYPTANQDAAQNAVSSVLTLFSSLFALLPGMIVGGVLVYLNVGPVLLALGVTLTNGIAALVALAAATHLWQRFDPTS